MNILLVCRGNVARSQIAEAVFKRTAFGIHDVVSAGTKLSGPEQPIGELMPAISEVLEVMREDGDEIAHYVRKSVTEEMAEKADKIILIVDDRDPIPEYLLNNTKTIRWDVLDPKGQSLEFTRTVRDQIKGLVAYFIK